MGVELEWSGADEREYATVAGVSNDYPGIDIGDVVVRVDPRYYRPAEVETLLGDASRAREELGWAPKITFEEMVAEMVESDLRAAGEEAMINEHRGR